MENNSATRPKGELLVFQGRGLGEPIQVRLEGETVWLSQKLLAELYGTSVPNINQHIASVYEDEELLPEATIKKYLIVQTEGSRQIKLFFATMQNKMHYAATGLTASEIVKNRANAKQPNMGLSNWKGSRVLKTDIGTAKNYLDKDEIDTLNRITVMFLDQSEFRAQRHQTIQMDDWEAILDKFLSDVELPVLQCVGKITHKLAQNYAGKQYDQFAEKRRFEAQQQADQNYISELKSIAETLKRQRQNGGAR